MRPTSGGYYGPPNPPVYTEIPGYTNSQSILVGVVCNQCTAVVQRNNSDAHSQWHEMQRRMTVSNVKWCDAGDHAFKAGRPGSQNVMGTEINELGQEVSVQQDVCPECAAAARQKRSVRELETVKPEECPECSARQLVYSQAMGANTCLACGWASNQFTTPTSVTNADNSAYGKHTRYMSDDRPEPA